MRNPPYPRYKPSGVDWVGDVPEHWMTVPLRRSFRVVNGGTPSSADERLWDGVVNWLTPEDLGANFAKVIHDGRRSLSREGLEGCGAEFFPAGSLIVSTRAPIGHVAIAGTDSCTNQGCRALVGSSRTSCSDYFYYVLVASKPVLQASGKGTTFLELSTSALASHGVPAPPINEQGAIADFLDRETARIDDLVAKKRALIAKLNEKRSALIARVVTRGLPPEAARAVGLDPHPKLKPSGVEWLGDVPAHWSIARLRHLIEGGTQNGVYKAASDFAESGVPMVQMREAFAEPVLQATAQDRVLMSRAERKAWALRQGDLLFGRRSLVFEGSGKCVLVGQLPETHVFESSLIRVRPDKSRSEPRFLHYFLGSTYARAQVLSVTKQVTISGVDSAQVKSLVLSVPPLVEQRAIIGHLDRETAKIDQVVAKVEEAIQALHVYRIAIIMAAVTGKIDVRDAAA